MKHGKLLIISGKMIGLAALLLCAAGARAATRPVIVWASDPAAPDETVLLTGEGLGPEAVVELTRLEDTPTTHPTLKPLGELKGWERIKPLQASGESLKFVVPKAWKEGIFACRVRSGEALSSVTLLNEPEPWWWQGDGGETVSRFGWIRVFGKSLSHQDDSWRMCALRADGRQFDLNLAMGEISPYALWRCRPKEAGDYTLYVHNGWGGDAGWRAAGSLTIAPDQDEKTEIYDVKDFGPDPGQALLAALKKAETNGGGTVYLPRGRYPVKDRLVIPPGTLLKGERMDLVSLYWPDFETPPKELISGADYGLEELTIYCQNHKDVVTDTADSKSFTLKKVRIRANCYFMIEKVGQEFRKRRGPASHTQCGAAVLLRGRNFMIMNCDIYASNYAIRGMKAKVGMIYGNTLRYGGRGYSIENTDRLILEGNVIEGNNLLSIGNDITTFWTSTCRNIYYHGNKVRQMYGADREMMTLDAGGGAYLGKVAKVEGVRMTLAADPVFMDYAPKPHTNYDGGAVTILSGKGAGQYRLVARNAGREWEVDRPWDIVPDETSLVSIAPFRGRHIFLENSFEDGGAVQLYGAAYETIIEGNGGARMDGFLVEGLSPHAWGVQPSLYCQVIGNVISEGNGYGPRSANFGVSGHSTVPGFEGPMVRGAIFRRNECWNNASLRIEGVTQDVVVEHNRVCDNAAGIVVGPGASGVLLRGNRFENVKEPLKGEGLAKALVVEK